MHYQRATSIQYVLKGYVLLAHQGEGHMTAQQGELRLDQYLWESGTAAVNHCCSPSKAVPLMIVLGSPHGLHCMKYGEKEPPLKSSV